MNLTINPFIKLPMESAPTQLEFNDLLAEVPDSGPAARAARKERAKAFARLRREKKMAELRLREWWASYYEAEGKAQMNDAKYQAAIESFEAAMAMVPSRTLLREHVAFCYLCLEDFETAKDLLLDILRDDPNEAVAYGSLAAYYMRADPNDEMVKKLLTRALEIDPGYDVAHHALGQLAQNEQRFEDALVHYAAVLEEHPEDAWIHYRRITIYLEQKRYREAGDAFDLMLRTADFSDPWDAELLEDLKSGFASPVG